MNEWFAHHLLQLKEHEGGKGKFLVNHVKAIESVLTLNHITNPTLAQIVAISSQLWRPTWLVANEPRGGDG